MEDVASFVLAGVALTGSPGPATLGLAAAGAAYGMRRSLALFVGILAGVLVVMMVTAGGLTGLMLAQPALARAVALLAAAYMLYLAYRIAMAPPPGDGQAGDRPPGFVLGVFLGVGNPKAYVAMAALFSGFVLVRDRPVADVVAKIVILVAIMIVVDWVWLLAGAALTRAFHRPVLGRAINIGFAVLLVASVALTLVL
ncbi:MAG: LysE family transporter [Proteobacteria bacterium]|nr:LysE family transporter [Pseudomonadota bacterium]